MSTATQTTRGIERGVVDRNSDEAADRFVWGVAGGKEGGVDLASRTIDGIASTINVDRDGEIILPEAFAARLGKFTGGSAALLTAHTHRTSTGRPGQIGWVVDIAVRKTDVRCKFRFVDNPNSAAEDWWKLASDPNGKGIMFSVGFIPVRWVYGSAGDLAAEFPEIRAAVAAAGLTGDDRLRVYTEVELLEISCVPVPSNREAMQLQAVKAFGGQAARAETAGDGGEADAPTAVAEATEILDEIAALRVEMLDALAEIKEMHLLSFEDDQGDARRDREAPPADDTPPGRDDAVRAQSSRAAGDLLAACSN